MGDEAAARACFIDQLRGPRVSRIRPARKLKSEGNRAFIAEQGATRWVPDFMLLHWYEGLLILEELEAAEGKPGHLQAAWWDEEMRSILNRERARNNKTQFGSALYAKRFLLHIAVTGKERYYRRKTSQEVEESSLVAGEDSGGSFGMQKIIGYLPPWEAWHNEKCGFYQDFYQVLWDSPYSEIEYASVENGCVSQKGATWEPDECLPSDLDPLRLAAKHAWIQKRSEQEHKQLADQKAAARPQPSDASSPKALKSPHGLGASSSPPPAAALVIKRERPNDVPAPAVKKARTRRDGTPLDQDLLRSDIGHDFASEGVEMLVDQVCSGWPKQPQDYPPGFKAAGPPGFCSRLCDCMDDRRAQQPWETRKSWLEESARSAAASGAVQAFAAQTQYVFRRGLNSGQCFLQPWKYEVYPDLTYAKAAAELATMLEQTIKVVLAHLPWNSLIVASHPVHVPAMAFLSADMDYKPLRFSARLAEGSGTTSLPPWFQLDADSGLLMVTRQPLPSELPLRLRVDLKHAEGKVAEASCGVTSEQIGSSSAPWCMAIAKVAQFYHDPNRLHLEPGVRKALHEHFGEIYDVGGRAPREVPLGAWLDVAARILRLLRSTAGAGHAILAAATPSIGAGGRPAPRTPTR